MLKHKYLSKEFQYNIVCSFQTWWSAVGYIYYLKAFILPDSNFVLHPLPLANIQWDGVLGSWRLLANIGPLLIRRVMVLNGFGRKWSWPIRSATATFDFRHLGNPRKHKSGQPMAAWFLNVHPILVSNVNVFFLYCYLWIISSFMIFHSMNLFWPPLWSSG